jgi:hypothetical protein
MPEKAETQEDSFEPKVLAGKHLLRICIVAEGLENLLPYLESEIVRKELDLNDSQKRDIEELLEWNATLDKLYDEQSDAYRDGNDSLSEENDESKLFIITEKIDKLGEKIETKMRSFLTPDQSDRLLEIATQIDGPIPYLYDREDDKFMRNLMLTPKQMRKILPLLDEIEEVYADENQVSEEEETKDEKEKVLKDIESEKRLRVAEKEINEKILEIFTSKQLKKFNQCKGKAIDKDKVLEELYRYEIEKKQPHKSK